MSCRAMQALYLLALDPSPKPQQTSTPMVFVLVDRQQTPSKHALCPSKRTSPQWVLEGDIKGCFDAISHEWLLTHIPMDKTILKKWLKAGYMDQHVLHPTEEGTPQGGIISPVLANMALDGLEKLLQKGFPEVGYEKANVGEQSSLIRYADDFIITGRSKEILEQEVKPLVEQFMSERGLTLSRENRHHPY